MKRIAIMALALTASAGLFAQGLAFSGYFDSGIGVQFTDETGKDSPVLAGFAADAGRTNFRFRLNGAYTGADGTVGANFRLQAQDSLWNTATTFVPRVNITYAYGWIKAFDGVLTLNAGIVDNGTWSSGGAAGIDDASEGLGLLAKISPITGLDFGLGAYIGSPDGGGSNNALVMNSSMALDAAKYTFSLGCTLPDLLGVTAVFRTASDNTVGAQKTARGVFGLRLLVLKELTAIVEAEFDKLEDFGNAGLINFYETIGYKLGDLAFGLNAGEFLSQKTGADDLSLVLNPWLSYALGAIVPRLDIVYGMGYTFDPSSAGSLLRAGTLGSGSAKYDADQSIVTVRPSVKFNIDSKTFVEIGDVIGYRMGATDIFSNIFYADFKWSF